jgi:hypothetical protein
LRNIEKFNIKNTIIGDYHPKTYGRIGRIHNSNMASSIASCKLVLGLWRKLSFVTFLSVGYAFHCVVVKATLGIGDAPFDLEENWGSCIFWEWII